MKIPFIIKVPDFKKEVLSEAKPTFYHKLSDQERDEYEENLIQQRKDSWACQTAASAYNLGVLSVLMLIMTNGLQILSYVQSAIAHFTGIK